MKRLARSAAGFTFVECLVVAAIVLLCASLLVPAIAAKQAQRDKAVCLNNLNMLSRALEAYCSDYGGYFPCKPAYGAASATYDKAGGKVKADQGLWRRPGGDVADVLLTNQIPYGKFSGSENCGVEDEMCIAFGANADPERRRVDQDGVWQTGPVGLGFLAFCGYEHDIQSYYCPAWDIPAARFKESCGPDMCPDGSAMGTGQINTLAAANELVCRDVRLLFTGDFYSASLGRAGNKEDAWYVKGGALGAQSSYVYRNQAVRQPPGMDDQAKLPVAYALPKIVTQTGCPSFKTQKLLGGRSIVADTFLRSYKDVKAKRPGYGACHHKDGYNVLYGDWHVYIQADPDGAILNFVQGPRADGTPVKPAGDFAPFDSESAQSGTAAGVFVDPKGQISGRAAIWHLFDAAAGIDVR